MTRTGRRGPAASLRRGRLNALAVSAMAWPVLLIVHYGVLTMVSAYPGPLAPVGPKSVVTTERSAWAEAGPCRRVGPVSDNGFGYWWTCEAVIHVPGARVVRTELGGSTLTPADEGHQVELVESCGSRDRCGYGRPGYGAWMFPLQFVVFVLELVVIGAFGFACVGLVMAVLGPRRRPALMRARHGADRP